MVTHPVFGYKMSYSRMLEVQARMLAAYVRGDIPATPASPSAETRDARRRVFEPRGSERSSAHGQLPRRLRHQRPETSAESRDDLRGLRPPEAILGLPLPPEHRDLVRLRSRLYDVIDLDEDQVLFIPLCGKCVTQITSLGRPVEAAAARDVCVVV